MKIKTYQEWLDVFAQEKLPMSRRLFQFGNLDLDLTDDQARALYESIVSAEPERPRCKIMRRIGPYDGTPLGCYSTVAWCDSYEAFEELLKGASFEHGLICIQEQAAADDAKPSGKSYPSVDEMLADMGLHETRARVLQLEVDELKAELAKLKKPEPEPEPEREQGPFVLLLSFPGEKPHYWGKFDTRKEAKEWADQDRAFAAPESWSYYIVTAKEWDEYCAKTAAPSNETPPAQDPS